MKVYAVMVTSCGNSWLLQLWMAGTQKWGTQVWGTSAGARQWIEDQGAQTTVSYDIVEIGHTI